MELAKENNIGFAVDVYPHYGSDVETTLRAGNDIRHALIGPGVYASHGYERSHRDGAENTSVSYTHLDVYKRQPQDVVEKDVHWYLMMADSYYSKPQREMCIRDRVCIVQI